MYEITLDVNADVAKEDVLERGGVVDEVKYAGFEESEVAEV